MHTRRRKRFLVLLLAVVVVMSTAGISHAAAVIYDLTADTTTVTMPDGTPVPIWGFALDGGPVTAPGPVLEANDGDDLTINLTNNLPEPLSIIIHGQKIETPVPIMQGGRVLSFTPLSTSYTFTDLKAGTYLYESGAHPAATVPMGLYGVLIVHPATPGQAYEDPVSAYDADHVLVFSDIDPTLNDARDQGQYGTPAYPSTVNYDPKYFLINGKAYPETDPIVAANGETLLLRFVNAGLATYNPMLGGMRMTVIAEDGNLLPFPLPVFSLVLPAGKTKDVIVTPADDTRYALFERSLSLSNAGVEGVGGMLAFLLVGDADVPPTVNSFTATPGTIIEGESSTLAWETTNAASVSIDQGVGSQPVDGSVVVSPTVTTTYTLTAPGAGGTAVATAAVTVIPLPVIDSFTATLDIIIEGESSTLAWETTNVTSVSIDQGVGSQPVDGSVVVSPAVTTTYTLTATGPGGVAMAGATVTVIPLVTEAFVSIAADDGTILESSEESGVGGLANSSATIPSALRIGDDWAFVVGERQYKTIVSFDTSTIPDGATVVSATLSLTGGRLAGTNPFTTHGSCFVDIVTGSFGGNPALQSSDFQAAATATAVAVMPNPLPGGIVSTGALNAAGLAAINEIGLTQMRVYFSLDDNDDNADDWVGFHSGGSANPANRPVLEVIYHE